HERPVGELQLEVAVRLASTNAADEVTAVVRDRSTHDREVRARVRGLLDEAANCLRRSAGLGNGTTDEDSDDLERNTAALQVPVDRRTRAVGGDSAVVAGELLEVLRLAEGERARGRQLDRGIRVRLTVGAIGDEPDLAETERQRVSGHRHGVLFLSGVADGSWNRRVVTSSVSRSMVWRTTTPGAAPHLRRLHFTSSFLRSSERMP